MEYDPEDGRVEDVPEPPSMPDPPSVPVAVAGEPSLERIVAQFRMFFVALTALVVAVNTLVVALSGLRTGQQVQAVAEKTDANQAQIRAVGKKADVLHAEVKKLDAARPRFTAPPADEPGP